VAKSEEGRAAVRTSHAVAVAVRPWLADDLWLLERLVGDAEMTAHLGGPETPEKIRRRHADYTLTGEPGTGAMFVIAVGADGAPAGSVGYWPGEWQGATIWEVGWSVLPEFQGRGIATKAAALVVAIARAEGLDRPIHAFPSVDNAPSNAICLKVGFTLIGECDFEYPRGSLMRCNDWVLDGDPSSGR
jgi:RimJ/RimL family protein N-acetyltransferase